MLWDTALLLQLTPGREIQGSPYLTHTWWVDTLHLHQLDLWQESTWIWEDPTCDKKWEIEGGSNNDNICYFNMCPKLLWAPSQTQYTSNQLHVYAPKTQFCSSVPFLNKWNHHPFYFSNQKPTTYLWEVPHSHSPCAVQSRVLSILLPRYPCNSSFLLSAATTLVHKMGIDYYLRFYSYVPLQ